ncbi:DUF397 domain-containing protein [Streptomyces sp. G5(2025)]|uniref:DUF397 domain-containing protein n=1 Tax=Streptomyces sp. G5(2025) TaxID=3406628 RepID=UPI003C15AB7F
MSQQPLAIGVQGRSNASDTKDESCVEAAGNGESVLVRDSTRPRGAVLVFRPQAWAAFLVLAARPAPAVAPHPSRDGATARR